MHRCLVEYNYQGDQNKMGRDEIRQKIISLADSIVQMNACQIDNRLSMQQKHFEAVIDHSVISKIKNISMIKLLLYEFVIYVNRKILNEATKDDTKDTNKRFGGAQQKIKGIRRLLEEACRKKKNHNLSNMVLEMGVYAQLEMLLIELEEMSTFSVKNRTQSMHSNDSEGTQILIEQLQQIIEKKQVRIRELNKELQQNFVYQQQLQEDFEQLEIKNEQLFRRTLELQQQIEELTHRVNELELGAVQLRIENQRLAKDIQKKEDFSHEIVFSTPKFAQKGWIQLQKLTSEDNLLESMVEKSESKFSTIYDYQSDSKHTKLEDKCTSHLSIETLADRERTVKKKMRPAEQQFEVNESTVLFSARMLLSQALIIEQLLNV